MTAYQEDDWELDINFGVNSMSRHHGSLFQKREVYSTASDKELSLAYERYKYPQQHMYFEDDDTNSSVTSGSVMSSKFSEVDTALNDLDDFMFDEPPSSRRSSVLLWTPVATNHDLGNLPGVVKKVTTSLNYQEVQDNDDWIDDIDIPAKGISSLRATPKCYDQQLTSLDDLQDFEEPEDTKKPTSIKTDAFASVLKQQFNKGNDISNTAPPSLISQSRNIFRYQPERDDEDDDMTGLDFPENMAILPKRLDEKKKYHHNPNITQHSSKSKMTTRIPISSTMKTKSKLLLSIEREKDDDDFCDGLHIKEKAFTIISPSPSFKTSPSKSSTLPVSSRYNQPQQSRVKGKEPASFVSRLARPTPLLNSSSRQSDHAMSLTKKTITPQSSQNNKQKPTVLNSRPFNSSTRFTARQVETNVIKSNKYSNARNNNNSQYLTINKSLISKSNNSVSSCLADQLPAEKRSATGYTLIARPKTKVTSYCARLDNLDNLNDLRPKTLVKKNGYTQTSQSKDNGNKFNSDRSWRKNIQTTNTPPDRSKVKLIQPNQQSLKKEYNDMTYDDSNHCWRGNETSLAGFQDKPAYRRPMLIMNKQQKNAPSRYAAVVGSSMIFNADSQKWVSANGQKGECNELDTIEDLKDELFNSSSSKENSSQFCLDSKQVDSRSKDFKLSILSKRRMMAEQEQHESWIANWPIKTNGHDIHF